MVCLAAWKCARSSIKSLWDKPPLSFKLSNAVLNCLAVAIGVGSLYSSISECEDFHHLALIRPKTAETKQTTPEHVAKIMHQPVTTCNQLGVVVPDSANNVPMTKRAMEKNEAEYPAHCAVLFAVTPTCEAARAFSFIPQLFWIDPPAVKNLSTVVSWLHQRRSV